MNDYYSNTATRPPRNIQGTQGIADACWLKSTGCLLAILAVAASWPAIPDDDSSAAFVSLCIEEQSTGFHWKEGKWSRAKFIPEKFLVEKLDMGNYDNPESAGTPASCLGMHDLSDTGFRNGCYEIRGFGEKANPLSGQVCEEVWSEDGSGDDLLQVICDGKITSMVFEPEGNFHYSKVHWLVGDRQNSDDKDSLVISVGKCSKI